MWGCNTRTHSQEQAKHIEKRWAQTLIQFPTSWYWSDRGSYRVEHYLATPWLKTHTHTHTHTTSWQEEGEKATRGGKQNYSELIVEDRTGGEIEIGVRKMMREIKSDKWRYLERRREKDGRFRRNKGTMQRREGRGNMGLGGILREWARVKKWKTPLNEQRIHLKCTHTHAHTHTACIDVNSTSFSPSSRSNCCDCSS